MIKHDKIFCHKKFRGTCSSVKILKGYMLDFRNAEGAHAHLSECGSGTWSKKAWEPLVNSIK